MLTLQEFTETIVNQLKYFAEYHSDPDVFAEYQFEGLNWTTLSEIPEEFENNSEIFFLREYAAKLIARKESFTKCFCGSINPASDDCGCDFDEDSLTDEEKEEFDDEPTEKEIIFWLEEMDWNLDYYGGDIKVDLAQHVIDSYDNELSDDAKAAADRIEATDNLDDFVLQLLNAGELQHHNGNLLEDYCSDEWKLLGEIRENGISSVFDKQEIEEYINGRSK